MTAPSIHAQNSVRLWGGTIEDYLPIHEWLDGTKCAFSDFRHRALRHHSLGVFWCEEKFGPHILTKDGRLVPTRYVAEQHIREDCGGKVPSIEDWLGKIPPEPWMNKGYSIRKGQ